MTECHFDWWSFFIGFVFTGAWVLGVLSFLRVFGVFPRRSFRQVAGDNSTQIQIGEGK